MGISRAWAIILLLLGCVSGEGEFGEGLKRVCSDAKCAYGLDFNHDGVVDSLILLRASDRSRISGNARPVGLRRTDAKFQPGEQPLLGIFLSNVDKSEYGTYVIHDESFFSSPIWQSEQLPVFIVPRDNLTTTGHSELSTRAKGDVIGLGTEAGIDIFIYWNGDSFNLFEPDEEP